MKIGAFAKHNQTSIDTIRHYMDLALLIPDKSGAHYDFDDLCQSAYDTVVALKAIGFSLSDIQMVLHFKRIGQLTDYDKREMYKAYFENKQFAIDAEISKLLSQKERLAMLMDTMSLDSVKGPESLGVPMEALGFLECSICHKPFVLREGRIVSGQIESGTLTCHCGKELAIEAGIVCDSGIKTGVEQDVIENSFIEEYIKTTDSDYLQKLYQGLGWSQRHTSFEAAENGVALELGTGHGFFLRHFIDRFPASGLYIAVDWDLSRLKWLKAALENNKPEFKILFLCADFNSLPVKDRSVDLLLDVSGSSNYAFSSQRFLLQVVERVMKSHCVLHGFYILFQNFMSHTKVDKPYQDMFKKAVIRSEIAKLGFEEISSFETEPIERGGPKEDYFVPGEKVNSYLYYGKR